ncbi:MAG: GH116 family glycosyl hydrolase [Terriglobia bacterium]
MVKGLQQRWTMQHRITIMKIASATKHATNLLLLAQLSQFLVASLGGARAQESPSLDSWVDVSHGIGVPIGGLGTGYSVFGKFGFVRVNFDGWPDNVKYDPHGLWGVTYTQEPVTKATFGFVLTDVEGRYVFQSTPAAWEPSAKPFDSVKSYAYLPKGKVLFTTSGLDLQTTVLTYTPLLPHDLATSTIPVQIYDVTLLNLSDKPQKVGLRLQNAATGKPSDHIVVFADKDGQMAFGAPSGVSDAHGVGVTVDLPAHKSGTARFVIGWYYPALHIRGQETRYYAEKFPNAGVVVARGLRDADSWSRRIDAWHDSFQVPSCFKRMWFSSLTSVMTSTMLTTEPAYYAIETPHSGLNTMDVNAYSSWISLVNWPELERMDMEEYFATTPVSGPDAGLVLHALPDDRAEYASEPTFVVRFYRDYLWFNDRAWAEKGLPQATAAANYIYNANHYKYLINSPVGNQSYDGWMMPGVSAFVNSAWIYGLYGLDRLSQILHRPISVGGMTIDDLRRKAAASFDAVLWNEHLGDWNCFFRTPDASGRNTPETTFTDQLFGKWMLAIDPGAETVLPPNKVRAALHTLYVNNQVDDPSQSFRGWVDGMLPGHKPDMKAGIHARTLWFGPQINLGSLLGLSGDESASLDIFRSVEQSMHGNDLAAGEWNKSINAQGEVVILPEEPPKDTPRFPPYPRYQSCWEYLPRLIGLQMDERALYVNPYHTLDFRLDSVLLAGTTFTLQVQSRWKKALLNGKPSPVPVRIPRSTKVCRIEFVR